MRDRLHQRKHALSTSLMGKWKRYVRCNDNHVFLQSDSLLQLSRTLLFPYVALSQTKSCSRCWKSIQRCGLLPSPPAFTLLIRDDQSDQSLSASASFCLTSTNQPVGREKHETMLNVSIQYRRCYKLAYRSPSFWRILVDPYHNFIHPDTSDVITHLV